MSDVTQILSAIDQGDPAAAEQLLPLVYEELRKLAAQKMAQEAPGQTLQATALVHEATGSDRDRRILNEDGHSTALQAGEAAEKAGVDTLFLCHFDVRQGLLPEELQREAQMSFKGKVIIPELYRVYEI